MCWFRRRSNGDEFVFGSKSLLNSIVRFQSSYLGGINGKHIRSPAPFIDVLAAYADHQALALRLLPVDSPLTGQAKDIPCSEPIKQRDAVSIYRPILDIRAIALGVEFVQTCLDGWWRRRTWGNRPSSFIAVSCRGARTGVTIVVSLTAGFVGAVVAFALLAARAAMCCGGGVGSLFGRLRRLRLGRGLEAGELWDHRRSGGGHRGIPVLLMRACG